MWDPDVSGSSQPRAAVPHLWLHGFLTSSEGSERISRGGWRDRMGQRGHDKRAKSTNLRLYH
jgi:hypothetical protein